MSFVNLNTVTANEIISGFRGKFVHTDNVTVAQWEIEAGAVLADHAHPHEQITMMIEGQFELTVDGETRVVTAGDVAVIPGHMRHSGKAITACRIMDVFHPARPEYRNA